MMTTTSSTGSSNSNSGEVQNHIQNALVPFFATNLIKGGVNHVIFGPFIQIEALLQQKALALLQYFSPNKHLQRALVTCGMSFLNTPIYI